MRQNTNGDHFSFFLFTNKSFSTYNILEHVTSYKLKASPRSEIFRSPSKAKYGGALSYVGFSSPTRSFIFTCYVKTAQGD